MEYARSITGRQKKGDGGRRRGGHCTCWHRTLLSQVCKEETESKQRKRVWWCRLKCLFASSRHSYLPNMLQMHIFNGQKRKSQLNISSTVIIINYRRVQTNPAKTSESLTIPVNEHLNKSVLLKLAPRVCNENFLQTLITHHNGQL